MSQSSNFNEEELLMTIQALRNEISKLEKDILFLKKALVDNDVQLEDQSILMSNEEYICINEISKLKKLSEGGNHNFSKDDAQILDTLYKNLRAIRGMSDDKSLKGKKGKPINPSELFKIVENK